MFNAAGHIGRPPPPVFSKSLKLLSIPFSFLPPASPTPAWFAYYHCCSLLALYFKLPPRPSLSSAMSSRRARASSTSDDEIHDLVLKLSSLLPPPNQRRTASAWRILKETCSYIERLQREVDDLSERLSQLLNSLESNNNGVEVEHLRSLLQQ